MIVSRRHALKSIVAAGALGAAGGSLAARPALAAGEKLNFDILGFTLDIHVPAIAALHEGLPALGYPEPKLSRISSMRVLTQAIIAGGAEIGESDVITPLRAAGKGADLRIVGMVYASSDLVWLANARKIPDLAAFGKGGHIVAVNSKGDFTYVMLAGALLKQHIDPAKVTFIEIGGSGTRLAALRAGRVDAVPVHVDQARGLMTAEPGKFTIVLKPWETFPHWLSEVWLTRADWLEKPENGKAVVAMLKAVVASFRKADQDFSYFADSYRKFATIKGAASASDDSLRGLWKTLSQEIKAWPADGGLKRAYFHDMMPVWRATGAISGKVDIDRIVETRYLDQALKELGT